MISERRKDRLLKFLAEGDSVFDACRKARVGRASYYRFKKTPKFAGRAEDAIDRPNPFRRVLRLIFKQLGL